MSKTYLLIGAEQQGPYSVEEIRAMLSAKKITAQTLYWEEGMSDWKALGENPDLRSIPKTVAPPRRQVDASSPVDFKNVYRDRKDLSARSKALTPAKAIVFLILFFVVLTLVIDVLSRYMPDPAQQFAERTGEISSHNR